MIDLKKLIGAFLVLATITSISAFTLLNLSARPSATTTSASAGNGAGVPQNAFVYPLQPDGSAAFASQNLTLYAAQSLVQKMADLNPETPKTVNGKITVAAPTAEDIMSPLAASGALRNIEIPDWGTDASFGNPVVLRNYKADELADYNVRFNEILDQYFVETNLTNMFAADSPPENIPFGEKAIGGAMTKIALLSVPEQLLDFHKSFLGLLSYEKNALALAENSSDDPLRASIIFRAQEKNYDAAIASLQKEFEKIKSLKGISDSKTSSVPLSLLNEIFGVKKAYAFWPTFDAAQFGNMIKEFVHKTLLQILKNTIIKQIQAQVLSFIKGGGRPMFITNFKSFLSNAVTGATNATLMRDIVPTLCPSYSSQVLSSLGILNSRFAGGGGGSCPRDRLLAAQGTNIGGFYNNFDNGGWAAYGALIPNNVYTATADAFDKLDKAGSDAQQAAQTKAIANQGMKGTEVCEGGGVPDEGGNCPSASPVGAYEGEGPQQPVGAYEGEGPASEPVGAYEGEGPASEPVGAYEGEGPGSEPQITTPGTGIGETMKKALTSNVDLIVNADDLAGLAAAAAESMMVKLINAGVAGLLKTSVSQPPPPPQPPGVSCSPVSLAGNVGDAMTFGATGGNGTYVWSSGGGTAETNTGPVLEVSFGMPGIYTVSVTSAGQTASCTATAVQPASSTTTTSPFGG